MGERDAAEWQVQVRGEQLEGGVQALPSAAEASHCRWIPHARGLLRDRSRPSRCLLAHRDARPCVQAEASRSRAWRMLGPRSALLVQNLRDSLLYLPTAEDLPLQMRLQLRDGSTYSVHPLARDRACERERVLRPFEVSVIDIELRAQEHMVFEPCLLEACRQLHARFQVAGGYQVSVTCRFVKEEEIWRHYDEINRDFLVHRDEIER